MTVHHYQSSAVFTFSLALSECLYNSSIQRRLSAICTLFSSMVLDTIYNIKYRNNVQHDITTPSNTMMFQGTTQISCKNYKN